MCARLHYTRDPRGAAALRVHRLPPALDGQEHAREQDDIADKENDAIATRCQPITQRRQGKAAQTEVYRPRGLSLHPQVTSHKSQTHRHVYFLTPPPDIQLYGPDTQLYGPHRQLYGVYGLVCLVAMAMVRVRCLSSTLSVSIANSIVRRFCLSSPASVSPAPLSCQRPKGLEGRLTRALYEIKRLRGGLRYIEREEGSERRPQIERERGGLR